MATRDIIVQLNSYPEPTPDWALEAAAAVALRLNARLSAGLCEVVIPPVSNWFANALVNADTVIAAENSRSAANADALLARFAEIVDAAARGESLRIACPGTVSHWRLAAMAGVYDLIVVPVYGHPETQAMAEGLVFAAGRPILLAPERETPDRLDHVVIGWDGGRSAARALADSIAMCRQAKTVTVASVVGEKDLSHGAQAADVVRHLARHDIAATAIDLPANGENAGRVLQTHCQQAGGDLLVMGAYGHSRIREFVLGGATRSVMENPKLPILLSH